MTTAPASTLSHANLAALRTVIADGMMRIRNEGIQEVCAIPIIDFEVWEWPQGVGLYGLWKLYQDTGDRAVRDRIAGWFDRRIAAGLPSRNVNTTAPMLTLAHLAEETGNPAHLALCTEWAEWVMRGLPRTQDGGMQHVVSGEMFDGQLWDDTLYMTVLFLAKMGMLLKRQDMIDEAVYQFQVHIQYLYDRATGLWYHGWNFNGRHNFAKALWARGNCWITAGTYDFLEITGLQGPARRQLVTVLAAQVAALEKFQHADGMWSTLIDDPASYKETSATAGFAYGILKGVRLGLLDPRYAAVGRKALTGVVAQIDAQGNVGGVSYGTPVGADLDHYRKIPICQMAYGQSLALLLLGEALRHP